MDNDRYIVMFSSASGTTHMGRALQDVLTKCPENYQLHSWNSWNEGGGYTSKWVVVFEKIQG